MHYHWYLKLPSSYYGHDKETEVIKTVLLIIKRRTVSINKVQLLAAFWVLMPANLRDSVRTNLSQSSQPPAPVAANLSSRDPAAQQTTIDGFKTEATNRTINVWVETLTRGRFFF